MLTVLNGEGVHLPEAFGSGTRRAFLREAGVGEPAGKSRERGRNRFLLVNMMRAKNVLT